VPQSIRSKLLAIAATTALAFLLLTLFGSLVTQRSQRRLDEIRSQHLPKMTLGPKLEAEFDTLRRSVQDAAAAQDSDALDGARQRKDALLAEIAGAKQGMSAANADALRGAIEEYFALASGVAHRMIDGETGEGLVDAIAHMQAQQNRTSDLLAKATRFDHKDLERAFAAVSEAENTGGRVRVAVSLICLLVVLVLTWWITRGLLRSLSELSAGLERFGRGEFARPIPLGGRDELGRLSERANEMAQRLKRLADERDRSDWIKAGHAGLVHELRGELEPKELAARVSRYLARYLKAPAAAFYVCDKQEALELLGQYAAAAGDSALAATSIAPGEGLVGQAARQRETLLLDELPPDYMRVRSGLGDARPRSLALIPLVHLDRVNGVIELALFQSWTPLQAELIASLSETLAIALEVARARTQMRELLAETQRQAQRLLSQEEELRATNEELQAQQEELQAQQEELKQTNEELTDQSAELQAQQEQLQQANSELQAAHERLGQKADELSAVSAYKSQFLANMSHELRTPLNSMLLLSNLLAQNESRNLSDKQVEFCKTINGAGKDLLALINQVLDLAKIESGKQEVRIEAIEVSALAARAERIFAPLARDKGLALEIELAEDAPGELHSDKQRIEQILDNLLGNAIKFTQHGSVRLWIGTPATDTQFQRDDLVHEQTLALQVRDTGIGIASEQLERVFAPFEQVDARPDRRYGGTGLGLTIARELCSLLGGELALHSELGHGSTFSCYLPLRAPAASSERNALPRRSHPPPALSQRPVPDDSASLAAQDAYLLIIEDDAMFAESVGDVIHKQGLKYLVAGSGERGLQLAREHKPSGIVLDVRLPDVDGFDVMEALRSDSATSSIPVHFVSALQGGERGMAMGAVGYLTKPASTRDLERVIESLARVGNAQYRILIVEDDTTVAESIVRRLQNDQLQAQHARSAEEARAMLKRERFACMVLDLSLPDMDGLELLRTLHEEGADAPPVIVHTGRALTKVEAQRLEAYAEAVVVKEGPAVERLLDEIRLFVRRLKEGLPGARRNAAARAPLPQPLRLERRKLLLVDDDMRTVYALSAVLRAKGAEVLVADTGRAALDMLARHPDVELVLMDIMMPEMDGYEAIRRLRLDPRFAQLPVIALTAKAMQGDREKCIEVGATDYLAKPIDPENLATILRERLPEVAAHG
jgi:CheY-like chemotaxis protein/HAMP domain-containing protein